MSALDVNRFLRERAPLWRRLEETLAVVEARGMRALDVDGARRFGKLYREVSADLVRARAELVDASVQDYLNDLVARAYAHIYGGSRPRGGRWIASLLQDLPAMVRQEWRAVALSAALLLGGGCVGAVAAAVDPGALAVLLPEQHAEMTPEERVRADEARGPHAGDEAAEFSSFLFTHNIQVSFLVFALGITFGIGTAALLFFNGVPVGALAVQYHQAGRGSFFWAWILPHGVPELTAIVLAGASGLLLARGLLLPGRRTRRDALRTEARRAVRMVLGTMPILVLAGLIEGTISQMHEPTMPYPVKLAFAAVVGAGLFTWLATARARHAAG